MAVARSFVLMNSLRAVRGVLCGSTHVCFSLAIVVWLLESDRWSVDGAVCVPLIPVRIGEMGSVCGCDTGLCCGSAINIRAVGGSSCVGVGQVSKNEMRARILPAAAEQTHLFHCRWSSLSCPQTGGQLAGLHWLDFSILFVIRFLCVVSYVRAWV